MASDLLINNFKSPSTQIIRKGGNTGECLLRTLLLDTEIKTRRSFPIRRVKMERLHVSQKIGRTENRKIGVALDT